MPLSDDFAQAQALHQQGQLPEAERLYRLILEADPQFAPAWHMLGLIAHQVGQHEPALECVQHALKLAPQEPAALQNLATILSHLGRHDEALAALQQVLKSRPDDLTVHRQMVHICSAPGMGAKLGLALRGLANALAAAKQYTEATAVYRQAAELRPQDVEIWNNLGVVCMEQGLASSAIDCYQKAAALRPQVAELHNNLGNALGKSGRIDEAVAAYRQALQIKPNYPKCSNNLGVMCIEAGRFDDAVATYRAALKLRPDLPELHSNLAVALKNLGRIEEAFHAYRQALTVDPKFIDAHHNLANLFLDVGQLDKAELAFRNAIALNPQEIDYHRHLAIALKRQAKIGAAREALEHALAVQPNQPLLELRAATLCPMVFASQQAMDDQRGALERANNHFQAQPPAVLPLDLLASHAEPPFHAQFFAGNLRGFREGYAQIFRQHFGEPSWLRNTGRPRIGFVVTKGHEGVFLKSLRGVIARLDAQQFTIAMIAPITSMARLRAELGRDDVEWIVLPERPERTIAVVRNARCDVLYHWEVGTDSLNYFLPMFHLAPVQCTSWGLQLTSGQSQMDYYLSSALVESPAAQDHYCERLWLAETLLTYQYRPQPAAAKTRDEFGLREGGTLYGCTQHLGKFHPDFDRLLGAILQRDSQAVFVVTQDRYNQGAETIRERWATTLPGVVNQIHWLPRLGEEDYRALLALCDVLLDPPHFGGVNSTYDGLAPGKPIVTCPTAYQRGRYTLGCYRKLGFLELVAADAGAYVELAVRLGTDRAYRADVSRRLTDASGALWEDAEAVTEHARCFEELVGEARRK